MVLPSELEQEKEDIYIYDMAPRIPWEFWYYMGFGLYDIRYMLYIHYVLYRYSASVSGTVISCDLPAAGYLVKWMPDDACMLATESTESTPKKRDFQLVNCGAISIQKNAPRCTGRCRSFWILSQYTGLLAQVYSQTKHERVFRGGVLHLSQFRHVPTFQPVTFALAPGGFHHMVTASSSCH